MLVLGRVLLVDMDHFGQWRPDPWHNTSGHMRSELCTTSIIIPRSDVSGVGYGYPKTNSKVAPEPAYLPAFG